MLKSKLKIRFHPIRIEHLFCAFLVLLITFSNFNNITYSSDIELEKIEEFADGEKKSKHEKLDNSEKDFVFSYVKAFYRSQSINRLFSIQNHSTYHTHFVKIPTPPPELI